MWLQLLIQLGLYAIKEYVKNTDSKQDDKILKALQVGAKYLAPKPNNTLNKMDSDMLELVEMQETQRAK